MNISKVIKKDIIFLNLDAASRENAIRAMVDKMAESGYVVDRKRYLAAIAEREKQGTTGVGFGVAIPHGKSDGVVSPCVAYARLASPVEWASFDGKPVKSVFLIGVPKKNAGDEHLRILIALSKKILQEEFRDALDRAETADEILRVFESVEEE